MDVAASSSAAMEMIEGSPLACTTIVPASGSLVRSNTLSAVSIDQLLNRPPEGDPPPSPAPGKVGQVNRLIRWTKSCLSDRTLADELLRTGIAVAIFICIVVLMTLAQMFSDRWFALYTRNLVYASAGLHQLFPNEPPLPSFTSMSIANGTVYATDPLFDHLAAILPDRNGMRGWLPDALLTPFLAISLVVTLLFPQHVRLKYQSVVVGRRLLWILSILYLFRMCSFLVTTVPNPVQNCIPKYPHDSSTYLTLVGQMATGKISACTDNIYSGHTTLATVLFYTNVIYARRWYFSLYSVLHVAAILFTILLTRLHYSVDVLIALFMTSFVYCLYHFLLLIHVDQRLVRTMRLDQAQLEAVGEDVRYLAERRIILRLTGDSFMRLLAWMDGMDLRTQTSLPRGHGGGGER